MTLLLQTLARGFVQRDGGCNRDIKALGESKHGYDKGAITSGPSFWEDAFHFIAKQERDLSG